MAKPASTSQNLTSAFLNAAKQAQAIALKHKVRSKQQLLAQFATEPCEDQAVATVEYTEDGFRFVAGGSLQETLCHTQFERVGFDKEKGWNLGEDGLLLMVLESPHEGEFDQNMKPKGPAQGTTGENIGKYLERQHHHLPHLATVAHGRYRLVLMNAIRYQCSLGVSPTSIFRDFIFRKVWEQGGRTNFVTRLKKYLKGVENQLIFVCCSKGETILPVKNGSDMADLRDLVYDAAKKVVAEDRLFRRPHPSSGWFCRKPSLRRRRKQPTRRRQR
ncbi:hypothetical protein LZ198_37100 [Myxococcus sp. K15C18031901]|uniref:hypothetical protein n=1 Tax=Myxococcus dinghuensis TaxID=2906761 RepID=UPI0020A795F2|nr:hypothetical protein [Myxococcus dinghuensis]MCP3104495.1 hypothetical protein [Myxococcus dinghuensis]